MKKEYLLLIAAIIGLSALLFYQKRGKTNYQLPQLEVLKAEADRLVLERGKEHVELRKLNGHWVIEPKGWRANDERVENMVAELKKIRLSALVSEKKNYRLYELLPEQRLTASLYHGKELLRQVSIGKCSSTFRQTYLMLKDDPKVYQALGNLKNNFFIAVSDLRDKTVMKISGKDLAAIDEVVLEREEKGKKETLKLVRISPAAGKEEKSAPDSGPEKDQDKRQNKAAETTWRRADGQPVKAAEVKALIQALAHLQCQKFIAAPGPEAFRTPAFRVVARGGGKEFSLALLKLKDGAYPARSSYVKETFQLPKWRAGKIVRDFSVYTGKQHEKPGPAAAGSNRGKSGKQAKPAPDGKQ